MIDKETLYVLMFFKGRVMQKEVKKERERWQEDTNLLWMESLSVFVGSFLLQPLVLALKLWTML